MIDVLVEDRAAVRTITLNRPEKKNALTPGMYTIMAKALNEAAGDFAIRAVVITGAGSAFTGGNDISDFLETPPTGPDSPVFHFLYALHDFPKPLIAAVHGNAVGIGTTALLHCDIVVAAPDSKFQMPFVNLGLVPEAGSSLLFPKLVGHAKASEIFLTGRPFGAEEALGMGLVNKVSPDYLADAISMAEAIAAQPPTAVINTKALLKSGHHQAVSMVMEAEGELFRIALESDEAQIAFMNFLNKKKG
jgi:enoyl-CoA hydratase/carnithine racemase